MLMIKNYTDSIYILDDINFLTANKMLRYLHRFKEADNFHKEMGYIGILTQAMSVLNHRVKLVPELTPTDDDEFVVAFKKYKFFDQQLFLTQMSDIDRISKDFFLMYQTIHFGQYDEICITTIKDSTKFLHDKTTHVYDWLVQLNGTKYPDTKEVKDAWDLFLKDAELIEVNILKLINIIGRENTTYTDCDPLWIYSGLNPKVTADIYPCYRDQMITATGSLFQFILQGLIPLSVYEQSLQPDVYEPKQFFIEKKMKEVLVKAIDHI
jgi:hypothetical protein